MSNEDNLISIRDDWSIKLGEHIACDGELLDNESFLVISHAHGDHYRENKVLNTWRQKKPIIVTPETRDLLDCFNLNMATNPGGVLTQKFGDTITHQTKNGESVNIKLLENRHILGSAQIEIEYKDGLKVGYSGDFNEGIDDFIDVDYLVLDSTYGDKNDNKHWTRDDCISELAMRIKEAYSKGPVNLLGSPGLIQLVLSELSSFWNEVEYVYTLQTPLIGFSKVYDKYGYDQPKIIGIQDEELLFSAKRAERYVRLGYTMKDFKKDNPAGVTFELKNFAPDNNIPIKPKRDNPNFYRVSLSCHAMGNTVMEYVHKVNPKFVVTDGARKPKSAKALAKKIEKELRIPSKSSLDL